MDKTHIILPRQYVGKWRNEEGIALNIFFFVDLDGNELKKIFMPVSDYKNLEIKGFLGNNCLVSLDEDDEGRTVIKSIELD